MKLERFTLAGSHHPHRAPGEDPRDRFPIQERLDYYAPADLMGIRRPGGAQAPASRRIAGVEELARRARGTPRIANRLLRRVRDFAQVRGTARMIPASSAEAALRVARGRCTGLDAMDRAILLAVVGKSAAAGGN